MPRSLCAWNASILQLLGDELLDADEATGGLGAGFVEPETAEQTFAFYGQVAGWLSRAQQALHNPDYELDVTVPAVLPLVASTPCSHEHTVGLIEGMGRPAGPSRGGARRPAPRCRGGGQSSAPHRAARRPRATRPQTMPATSVARPSWSTCRSEIEPQVCCALDRYYLVGQLAAMPRLALQPLPHLQRPARHPGRPTPFPGAGRRQVRRVVPDRPARQRPSQADVGRAWTCSARMWAADPDPVRTLAIKAEIDGALFHDDIAHDVGHFDRCPWSPIYLAKRPVRLGTRRCTRCSSSAIRWRSSTRRQAPLRAPHRPRPVLAQPRAVLTVARPPEVIEFDDGDRAGIVAAHGRARAAGAGWINFEPVVDPEELPPRGSALFGIFSSRGPIVPLCTWTPAGLSKRETYVSLGVQHPTGTKAAARLSERGVAVDEGLACPARLAQGRPASSPSPPTESNERLLDWLVRAGAALCPVDNHGRWVALVYRT